MNWYYDNEGMAEGPFDEERMTALAVEHRIDSQSMVWNPSMEEWSSVGTLAPSWWSAALPAHEPVKPASLGKNQPALQKIIIPAAAEDVAVRPAPTPLAAGESSAPKRRLTAPMAPTGPEPEEKNSGGVLKKIFGFGKKKAS